MIIGKAITAGGSGGIKCKLNITTSPGAAVTATLGEKVVEAVADENGKAILKLSKEGVWTVTATYDGETVSKEVDTSLSVTANLIFVVPILANNSWEKISEVARAGKAPQYWKIGDVKPFTMNGYTYNAQIVAFDHFDVADPSSYGRSKAGIVFQFKECIPITKTRTDALNYANEVATSLLECKDYIPIITYLQGSSYNNGASYYQQAKGICPSEIEIVGSIVNGRHSEGTLLAYYAAGNSKVKHTATSASPVEWWTRTFTSTKNQYVVINTSGQGVKAADAGKYCAPVFCL